MNEFQYCYWLMGIFELGNPERFNKKQLNLVKEHLKLVEYLQYTFCNWFEGYLDAINTEDLSSERLNKVLEKLRFEFLMVIDKSYPKEIWSGLSNAHEGKEVENKHKFEAMC